VNNTTRRQVRATPGKARTAATIKMQIECAGTLVKSQPRLARLDKQSEERPISSQPAQSSSSSGHIDTDARQVGRQAVETELEIRVASGRVLPMVFQPVEVLVALAASLTSVWLLFLHANGTRVGDRGFGIDDRERAVAILFEFLATVTVLYNVSMLERS
jgi:hypothetical protein